MGYTNYYTTKENAKGFSNEFLGKCEQIIQKSGVELANWDHDNLDSKPTLQSNEICFNGKGKEGHETFRITNKAYYSFTKTNGKPYDVVIKSILILAEKYDYIKEWSFDGSKKNDPLYAEALELLKSLEWSDNKD